MKTKTSDLIGPALDWAVCRSGDSLGNVRNWLGGYYDFHMYRYSTIWSEGGPIIEREGIDLWCNVATNPDHPDPAWRGSWRACYHSMGRRSELFYGPTPLIAAMRAYVAFKLGEEVEVPEELQ